MSEYKIGTKFIAPTGDTYILAKVSNNEYALIGLSTGNRWSNPCKVPVGYNVSSLDKHRLRAMMNDSSYTTYKVWDIVPAVEPVAPAVPVAPKASEIEFPVQKKKKPDVVQVTRYFRPRDKQSHWHGVIDSSRGVTANYVVNYVTNTFIVKWSVCNGDNFNKELGFQLANLNTKKAIIGKYNRTISLFDNLYQNVLANEATYDRNLVDMVIEIKQDRNVFGS